MEGLTFDLAKTTLRELNQFLHSSADTLAGKEVLVANPDGAHNIAVGCNAPVKVTIDGHAGYYAGGMNQLADITALTGLLAQAGLSHAPTDFKRVASARSLYHWNADADQTY